MVVMRDHGSYLARVKRCWRVRTKLEIREKVARKFVHIFKIILFLKLKIFVKRCWRVRTKLEIREKVARKFVHIFKIILFLKLKIFKRKWF